MGKKNKRGGGSGGGAAGSMTRSRPETEALREEEDEKRKRRRLSKPLTRESTASKAVILERMQRARLERGVERGRSRFRRHVPPKPKPLPGPAGWKLRGAARPWEEVEALKTADLHEKTVDAVALHGAHLVEQIPSSREWRDALVDLFLENGDVALLEEALSIDAADERGAGLLALDARVDSDHAAWCAEHLTSDRALPRWTLFFSRFLADDENEDQTLRTFERALEANSFAFWLVAYPQQADSAIEYEEEIGHDFKPAGILEAVHVHLHARRFFEEKRPATRAAVAAYARTQLSTVSSSLEQAEESHPNAAMFINMFSTLKEMVMQPRDNVESAVSTSNV